MFATFCPANPIFKGAPEEAEMMPDISQPPSVDFSRWLLLFFNSGIWYTKLVKKIFLMSKAERP